jgi:hypothetical protein
MANMTPEERERVLERMRARGFPPPGDLTSTDAGAQPQQRSRSNQQARPEAPAAPAQRGATTFDALFGPLTPTENFGQVWIFQNGKLERVRLRLGVSDGQQTELIQALDGPLQEGSEVVTSVTIGPARQTATPQGGTAFPGLGGRQTFPGGGGGRGRGF